MGKVKGQYFGSARGSESLQSLLSVYQPTEQKNIIMTQRKSSPCLPIAPPAAEEENSISFAFYPN